MVSLDMENNRTDPLTCRLKSDTWRYRPGIFPTVIIRWSVRVRVQRISVTKTQFNLVRPGFSKTHSDEDRKALVVFLVVICVGTNRDILIEILVVLLLLQPQIHFSSCFSHHFSREEGRSSCVSIRKIGGNWRKRVSRTSQKKCV